MERPLDSSRPDKARHAGQNDNKKLSIASWFRSKKGLFIYRGLSRSRSPAAYRLEEFMLDSEDTHEQNIRERIERDGLEVEIGRQADVERLKSHMEAFYEHGSRADIRGLCEAFESLERKEFSERKLHRACLLEEIQLQTAMILSCGVDQALC